MAPSLTEHLISLTPSSLKVATEHPFLLEAGKGTLSADRLAAWLTQDRLYGLMGYTKLLGGLLQRCPSFDVPPGHPKSDLYWKRLRVLGGAMSNITREMAFFEDVARKNGLPLDVQPPSASSATSVKGNDEPLLGLLAPTTRGYIDYMATIASTATFEEALVLLWSMEHLYLTAWRFALSTQKALSQPAQPSPAVSALSELIPNWTSREFEVFVEEIAELVEGIDEEWKRDGEKRERLEAVWKACVYYEQGFWEAGSPWGH
ncbi:heme oxygenase-like protein [Jaminaea rosea]|uniref:Heme oxygenase-like protein n=1 Tax=Jaminaea rosea TaxID=1569628 RepID=A0A316UMA9_9BASI|nr:heme oxygenase-like protein [Jaminaea rosea]PWN25958.1 heme oxygenase-like protein [Jaminaea rosea]